MKYNRIILIVVGIILSIITYAQNHIQEFTMPSPNAIALGVYSEIPVSLYTGVPQIEVQIYNVKQGAISLPIYLSFHASGVKLDQHQGWVGLNWCLNSGGAITRFDKDLPDEYNCPNTTLKRYHHALHNFDSYKVGLDIQ